MIFKAPELVPLAQKTVSTDFGALDLIKLAKLSSQIDRNRVVNLVVDGAYASPYVTSDGADVLIPNRPAIQAAIQQAFSRSAALPTPSPPAPVAVPPPASPTPTPTPSAPMRLEVLNGTTRAGLAQSTADLLRQKGYVVARIDNAESADYPDTRLLVRPGRETAALALASSLGLPSTAVQSSAANAPAAVDMRLILGRNFQLPSAR
jgi:hypothetical protein